MTIPQLRVRTEYSFRTAYGSVPRIADVLEQMECPAAGIVDTKGTWGHIEWVKRFSKSPVKALLGSEMRLEYDSKLKPRYWVLAKGLAAMYDFTSHPPVTEEELKERTGVVRFAGAALTDPDAFDYIDINPRSRRRTQAALSLAKQTGKPIVITSDADYPAVADRDLFLAWDDSKKMTPQHLLTLEEMRDALWYVDRKTFDLAIQNTFDLAAELPELELPFAPIISVPGSLVDEIMVGKAYRLSAGHILDWTEKYEQRLQREIELIKSKNYESYFLAVADMVKWAKQHMLVGPARGSSAGSLVCYLIQITEVDPLRHNLLFERFIDVNRMDLPDIDVDFSDKRRQLVFDYMAEKYGAENVARIGSINRLKPRSAMAHVSKKLSIPVGATFPVLNVLIEYSSGDSRYGKGLHDTLTDTRPGKDFMQRFPEAQVIADLENHASHTGIHAAGIIISNKPIHNYCTVIDGVAHVEKFGAEDLGLLKIDALGLRTLGIIEDAGCITADELYALTLDDEKVFAIYNQHKFSGVFQFEGAAQRKVSQQVLIKGFDQLDHVTALARPGPLGSGATDKYINRASGKEPITFRHPSTEAYLGETLGLVLYQEQVMRIALEIGQMNWNTVSELRKAMSASKGKEYFDQRGIEFMEGAMAQGLSKSDAETIWAEIVYFGGWGMNKSHTVSYAIISYWCAYMKCYHPVEFAAACLRQAKDDEQTIEILRELTAEGVPYEPFDPELSAADWTVADDKVLGGFKNLVGIGPVKAAHYVHKRSTDGLSTEDKAKLAGHTIKFADLRPAHTLWHDIYDNPDTYNIHGRAKEFGELRAWEDAAVICKVVKVVRRDENETVLVHKRGGVVKTGQTLYLDIHVVDDSVSKPIIARIKPPLWHEFGEEIADTAVPGDWFLMRGKWLKDFSMLLISKIKCIMRQGEKLI